MDSLSGGLSRLLFLHGCETSPFSFPWPEISQRVPESKSDPVCLKLGKENSARQCSLKSHNKRLGGKKQKDEEAPDKRPQAMS